MIKPDPKLEPIINAFSPAEWEALALADLKSGKTKRMPKELRRELVHGNASPMARRWRKAERVAAKRAAQKARHDGKPSSKFKKAIAAARAMRRNGATIREIAWRTGLYWRTVLEHTKQDKP